MPQLLQAGSGGLQVPLLTCSYLWGPELAASHLHPSLSLLCQAAAEAADTTPLHGLVLLQNNRISWEGATTDLPLRRVLFNLRCEVSEGLHVSTPTHRPCAYKCPFFSLLPSSLFSCSLQVGSCCLWLGTVYCTTNVSTEKVDKPVLYAV